MNLLGILFGDAKSTASFGVDLISIEFDATMSEVHSWTNDITTNPVENGSTVADHILNNPDEITLTGFITNTPITGELIDQYKKVATQIIDGKKREDRVDAAIGMLKELMDKKLIVTVFTKYLVYPNMAIRSINFPRNASSGDSIEVTINFIKLNLVSTQTVKVPDGISKKLDKKSTDELKKKTDPQKAAGAKQPLIPKAADKATSVLSALAKKYVGGGL